MAQKKFHLFPASILKGWYEYQIEGAEIVKYIRKTETITRNHNIDNDFSVNINLIKTKHKDLFFKAFENIEDSLTAIELTYIKLIREAKEFFIYKKPSTYPILKEAEDFDNWVKLIKHFSITLLLSPSSLNKETNSTMNVSPNFIFLWLLNTHILLNKNYTFLKKNFLKMWNQEQKLIEFNELEKKCHDLISIYDKTLLGNYFFTISPFSFPLFNNPMITKKTELVKSNIIIEEDHLQIHPHMFLTKINCNIKDSAKPYDKNLLNKINYLTITHAYYDDAKWEFAFCNYNANFKNDSIEVKNQQVKKQFNLAEKQKFLIMEKNNNQSFCLDEDLRERNIKLYEQFKKSLDYQNKNIQIKFREDIKNKRYKQTPNLPYEEPIRKLSDKQDKEYKQIEIVKEWIAPIIKEKNPEKLKAKEDTKDKSKGM